MTKLKVAKDPEAPVGSETYIDEMDYNALTGELTFKLSGVPFELANRIVAAMNILCRIASGGRK